MFATSADWSFDSIAENFYDKQNEYILEFKALGAVNFFYVQTSPTTARSMMVWPDKETAHAALVRVREGVAAENGSVIVSVCEGDILASF